MVRLLPRCALLLAVIGHSACADPDDQGDEPIRADSAGVALVANAGPDRPLAWTFEPILKLGSVEGGPTSFFRVFDTSVGADSAGNLYVLDAGEHRVSVFDAFGRHVRSFGRQGQGPGEFEFPSDLAVSEAGGTAVYDFAKRALVQFDAQGSYTGLFQIEGVLQREVSILRNGMIAAIVAQPTGAGDSSRVRLLIIGSDTTELAGVSRPDQFPHRQFECPIDGIPSLFLPRLAWDAAGDRVAVSDDADYTLRIHDGPRLIGIWSREMPRIPATLELAAWEIAGGDSIRVFGCVAPAERAAAELGFSESVPIIRDVAVAPDGGLWVLRSTHVPGDHRIDVFDATGKYLGTLPAGSPFPAVFRKPNDVVTVEADDHDVPHVRVYRLRRPSSEL